MATGSLYGSTSESTGLYGIGAASGGTYFEWFIFYDSATAPATPTGGSWSFTTNTGTAPTGWLASPPASPVNQVWVSLAIVDSRSTSALTWTTPGLMSSFGNSVANYLTFVATSAPAYSAGRLWYDTTQKAFAYYNDVTGNVVHIGQETQLKVYNNTGSTITRGAPVYITSTSSGFNYPLVALAKADNQVTGACIGLANQDIPTATAGYITTAGLITGNTGSFTVGDTLYVSPYSAGQLMNTVPPTGYAVKIGIVAYSNTPNGTIYVSQTNAYVTAAQIVGAVAIANGGTGATTASAARTALGLGTLSTQDASNVAITGGSISLTTALPIASGGTAGTTAATARSNLGAVGLSDTQTLTNKTISGASNTLTNIPNSSLNNSTFSMNGQVFTLGAVQTVGANLFLPSYTGNAGKVLALNPSASDVQWISAGGVGTVTSIDISGGTTGLTTFGGPITAAGTITLGGTLAIANGGTGAATAATARTNLGATTVGSNMFSLTNPSAITFPRFNADNTVSALDAAAFRTAIGAGTGTGSVTSVAASVPAFLSISGSPVTTSGTLAIGLSGTALPVANGGTGVTASSGVNSVVLRDANANISANSISEGYSNVAAAGTTTVLTVSSVPNYVVTGSGGQTYQLPDATTLSNGTNYVFNNNQSSGTIVVKNNSSTTVATIQSGGYVEVVLLSNAIAAGSWDVHNQAPSNVSWSTNTFDYPGSITSATWNGATVATNRGGTGLTSFTANGVVYASSTSALTTGSALTFDGTNLGVGTGSVTTTGNFFTATTSGYFFAGAGTYTGGIYGSNSGNYANIKAPTDIVSYIGSTEGMRLTSTGLGIGTSSPGAKLDVNGTVQIKGGNTFLLLNSDNTNYYFLQSTGATGSANAKLEFVQGGVGTRLLLDSSGNLLLGTTSTSGSVSNVQTVAGGIFKTASGSTSVANATATTLATLLNQGQAVYMVTAGIAAAGSPTLYSTVAIVSTQGTATNTTTIQTGTNIVLSMSGLNLQVTQTAGTTYSIAWTILRIA